MAKICVVCSKSKSTGSQVSHSNMRTKRKWNPNIQRIKIMYNGSPRRVNVCTRCIKANKIQRAI